MVNTGLPSRDCETCRRRRVKCDLRRPGCLRCEKIRQECSGYRDLGQLGVRFRIHTPSSYNARGSEKKSKQTKDEGSDVTETTHRKTSVTRSCQRRNEPVNIDKITLFSASELSLARGLVESSDMHVMPLIVDQFSLARRQGGARVYGSLECIPTLLRCADSDSSLYLACHAVSHAYLANKSRSSPSLISKHRTSYGKCLLALKLALEDPELQTDDATLLTVWILCLYELILGTAYSERSSKGPLNWDIHSRALVGLLRLRGRQQFDSRIGCQLFQLVYHTIQKQSLQTGFEPPPEAFEWFDAIGPSVTTARLAFVPTYPYIDEVIRLCGQIKGLTNDDFSENTFVDAINIIQACNKLEMSLKYRFEGQINGFASTIASQLDWEQSRKHILASHNRNYIDACFICLHYSILELLLHILKQPDISTIQRGDLITLRQASIHQTRSRAERILTTLPSFLPSASTQPAEKTSTFSLNWADALRLMWPIRMIASSPVVLDRQKSEARSVLMKVAYEGGIMQAVGTYFDTFTALLTL